MALERSSELLRDIVVVGGSAGGIPAAKALIETFPADFPAAVFLVIHIPPGFPSLIPEILAQGSRLPVQHGRDGDPIRLGNVYVAPPGKHLLVRRDRIVLERGPRENGHRPSIDALFRTAAEAYGSRVVAIVLSGTLDDGSAGLAHVTAAGGLAFVQSPEEAEFGEMPANALARNSVDAVLPVAALGAATVAAVRSGDEGSPGTTERPGSASPAVPSDRTLGAPSFARSLSERNGVYSCPECGGALWEVDEKGIRRFECRVGHQYSPEGLAAGQAEKLEAAFWTVLRSLEESASLYRRLRERANGSGQTRAVKHYDMQLDVLRERIGLVRSALLDPETLPETPS